MSMQSLLAASQSIAKMQTMQSAKSQMKSSANVLRIESKQDGGNQKKLANADALDKKSDQLMGNLMGELANVNETTKPNEEIKAENNQEEKILEKDKKADSVTLSNIAAEYRGSSPIINPVMGEAVTYDAGGSKTPSTPTNAASTFKATA